MLAERLVAHRGYQALYPENTLLSLSRAVAAGARYIETDVLFSRDCRPLLYHDALMQRVSGLDNAVHLLPLAELTGCPAFEPKRLGNQYKGEKISPLEGLVGLLSTNPEVTAFVELKRSGLHILGPAAAYAAVIASLQPVLNQVVLISFDIPFIEYAHQQGFSRLGIVLKQWTERFSASAETIRPEFFFCDWEKIPASDDLNLANSKLVLYEVADPELAIELFNRGADMLETFDIGGMLETLSRHAI